MASKVTSLAARRYDGASKQPRTANWLTPGTDATAAIGDGADLRNRARDLVRNNPFGRRIIDALTDAIIATGPKAAIRSKSKLRARTVQEAWNAFTKTCDAQERMNFDGLVQQAVRCLLESGETLLRLRPRPGHPVPIAVQLLEPDYLVADLGYQTRPGGYTSHGIVFDAFGRRTAYRLYQVHPGTDVLQAGAFDSLEVPAEEIIHAFRVDRPGQQRGVTVLAPVIIRLRELGIYQDAVLKGAQLQNLFAGFLKRTDPTLQTTPLSDEEIAKKIPDVIPGTVALMPDGTELQWSSPPEFAVGYTEFIKTCLRDIAPAVGLSYEVMTGDLAETNFSSGRLGATIMARAIEGYQYQVVVPQLLDPLARWFLQALPMAGIDPGDAYFEWTLPVPSTIVDPEKEYSAWATAIRTGLCTWPVAVRQLGYDPETQMEEIADFAAKLKELTGQDFILDWGAKPQVAPTPPPKPY